MAKDKVVKILGKVLCTCGIHKYLRDTAEVTYLYKDIYKLDNWCSRCGHHYCSMHVITNSKGD